MKKKTTKSIKFNVEISEEITWLSIKVTELGIDEIGTKFIIKTKDCNDISNYEIYDAIYNALENIVNKKHIDKELQNGWKQNK